MNPPLVSVCLVVCDVERFLAESIQSILDQTFKDFELVIVDFGSTDQTIPIVNSFRALDSRVRFYQIPSCGLAEARNAACEFAAGRYVAIMDADDVAMPNRLELQVRYLEAHPEVGALGGATQWIDRNGRVLLVHPHSVEDPRAMKARYLPHSPFCQPTVLLRREIFFKAGAYRAAFAPAEDIDLWMRMAELSALANLSDVILKYRIHPYQVSQRKLRRQTLCALGAQAAAKYRRSGRPDPLDAVEEITPEVLSRLGVGPVEQQTALAGQYLGWIRAMAMAGDRATALQISVEMSRASKWELVAPWLMAEAHLTVAALLWKEKKWFRSAASLTHAFWTRPMVAARPIRKMEQKIRTTYKARTFAAGSH